jgi:hypothetical protein
MRGDYDQARQKYLESTRIFEQIGDQLNVATCLIGFAALIIATQPADAAVSGVQLLGYADKQVRASGGRLQSTDSALAEHFIAMAREKLGAPRYEQAFREGQNLLPVSALKMIGAQD